MAAAAPDPAQTQTARTRLKRWVTWRAARRDPRWTDAHGWHDVYAPAFRTPAKACPRGHSSEVARRELLTWSGWSGRAVVRVLFDFETDNCRECGSRLIDRCPRCGRKFVAPVADRCEQCGLPQAWSPDRLATPRRRLRQWDGPHVADVELLHCEHGSPRKDGAVPKRRLLVLDDDITSVAVDAIVSNDDVDGQMFTVIASAIRAAAGQQVQEEAVEGGWRALGTAWSTGPGNLSRRKGIIHVAAMDRRGDTKLRDVLSCVEHALAEARRQGWRSVAIGAFGTGPPHHGPGVIDLDRWLAEVARAIVVCLKKVPADEDLAVVLVLYEPDDFKERVRVLRDALEPPPPGPKWWRSVLDRLRHLVTPAPPGISSADMARPGENPTYDLLIASLLHHYAGSDDMRAVQTPGLSAPQQIGRHIPEMTARSGDRFIIGVARTGFQLEDETTTEALEDFLAWRGDDGERAVIHIRVPAGWEAHARRALARAGGDPDDELNDVGSVSIPGVVPPP